MVYQNARKVPDLVASKPSCEDHRHTALANKNTFVRLGSDHPDIVRIDGAFQDDWSLCESLISLSDPAKRYLVIATMVYGYCRTVSIYTILASSCLQETLDPPTHLGYRKLFQQRCPLTCRWATSPYISHDDPIATAPCQQECLLRRCAFHPSQGVRGFSSACLCIPRFLPCMTWFLGSLLTSCLDLVLDRARNGEVQSRILRMGSL